MIFLGIDIGQAQDYSAISVIDARYDDGSRYGVEYRLLQIERLPLGTPYSGVIARVGQWTERLGWIHAVFDATGVGRPVVELAKKTLGQNAIILGIVITGGTSDGATADGLLTVPKVNLITSLQLAFQAGLIKIPADLYTINELKDELMGYRRKQAQSGYARFEPERTGDHDDQIMALALGLYLAARRIRIKGGPRL